MLKTFSLKKRIALFASGSGSNAQKIMEYFKKHDEAEVAIILTNNPEAYILQRADNFEIPSHIFSKNEFTKTDNVVDLLKNLQIDLIILAGFLWLIPQNLLKAFPNKIINIHPALLPKYGGKGMYGDKVHQSVLDGKEEESGITIHFVNECYDEGGIIFQASFPVLQTDMPEDVARKGQVLEHKHFPEVIERTILAST